MIAFVTFQTVHVVPWEPTFQTALGTMADGGDKQELTDDTHTGPRLVASAGCPHDPTCWVEFASAFPYKT